MIKSFKHKGLKTFFETGNTKGIQTHHQLKLRRILAILNAAKAIEDVIAFPSLKCHALKGKRKDQWSVSINGNWRITFKIFEGNIYFTDYEDYH